MHNISTQGTYNLELVYTLILKGRVFNGTLYCHANTLRSIGYIKVNPLLKRNIIYIGQPIYTQRITNTHIITQGCIAFTD